MAPHAPAPDIGGIGPGRNRAAPARFAAQAADTGEQAAARRARRVPDPYRRRRRT
ncbi:protein of unassigned function [Methylobacterium oryzae CBMB20]|uniref:Protein of unassigned function n=1 Tax=Methylobacterium oryzae CBMB20 TaxID=693986 RepID=A0A089NZN8_9HYPH|nr:protein of unassigned function [Methylobacterium oryzae CBMB20]